MEQVDKELIYLRQQLIEAAPLSALGELTACIAHDLNNPLTAISLRIELLKMQLPSDHSHQNGLMIIEQEVQRMKHLISNLLEFRRQDRLRISSVTLQKEIERTLELVQTYLRKQMVTVRCAFAPVLPPVQADPQNLRQLFLNLFINAGQTMADGGTLTIRTGIHETKDQSPGVFIEFISTGIMTPLQDLDENMESFPFGEVEEKSLGIGLDLCKRIVQAHRGKFEIHHQAGQGSVVSITLSGIHKDHTKNQREAGEL
jgi:two-component system, NtrC family, sensor kinase